MEHYLDNAATTCVLEPALKKAVLMMTDCYGNPSAQHSMGASAAFELEAARKNVLSALGASPGGGELFFTSGGTESINTAIRGVSRKYGKKNRAIVSTGIEHAATLKTLKQLAEEGFEITHIRPDRKGNVSAPEVIRAAEDACLVTMMAVNNETGAVLPVSEVKRGLIQTGSPALLHVDGVQAFLKTGEGLAQTGADLISVSGHKIGAMKGSGALFIKKGIKIPPLLYGGGQEKGMRPGTETLPAIASLGEACAYRLSRAAEEMEHIRSLNEYARRRLLHEFPGVVFNSPEDAAPHILNLSLPGAKSEVLMRVLQQHGVFVSAGSACSRGHRSYVLRAMELAPALIDAAIRVSFCPENTRDDIDALCAGLKEGAKLFVR